MLLYLYHLVILLDKVGTINRRVLVSRSTGLTATFLRLPTLSVNGKMRRV